MVRGPARLEGFCVTPLQGVTRQFSVSGQEFGGKTAAETVRRVWGVRVLGAAVAWCNQRFHPSSPWGHILPPPCAEPAEPFAGWGPYLDESGGEEAWRSRLGKWRDRSGHPEADCCIADMPCLGSQSARTSRTM